MTFDFHTHNQNVQPGTAIVNLPAHILLEPTLFAPKKDGMYSVGVHPWWLEDDYNEDALWRGVETLAQHPQVVAIGECGLDKVKGHIKRQMPCFERHAHLAETLGKPLIIHCVRAIDEILAVKKRIKPNVEWTIHGFRGKPQQAEQLIRAGLKMSFGIKANPETVRLIPEAERRFETDDDNIPITEVIKKFNLEIL